MGFDNFAVRWRGMEEENKFSASRWMRLPEGDFPFLQPEELLFLREVGLPGLAPYFDFYEVEEGVPRVDAVYGPDDEELWARNGREKVADFRMLGTDGGGNPLALNIHSREIWLLDHEGAFASYHLVNTSLAAFTESLLLFKPCERQAPEVDIEALLQQLRVLDLRAAQEDAFWHQYAHDLNDFRWTSS